MNQLLIKSLNIPITEFKRLPYIKAPQLAKSYDFVKVLHNNDIIDILTFRDKKGKPVKKFFQNGKTITERTYIGYKISTIVKQAGIFQYKSEETRFKYGNILNISKIESRPITKGVQSESQSLWQYRKGRPRKGYEIFGYLRTRKGINDLGHGLSFNFENIYPEAIEYFKKDPYFLLHLYSWKQFLQVAPNQASHPEHQVRKCKIKYNILKSSKLADYNPKKDEIRINKLGHFTKKSIINSAAHEREHVYQIDNNLFTEEFNNYISAKEDEEKYFNQLCEKNARIAGTKAELAYVKSLDILEREFKYSLFGL